MSETVQQKSGPVHGETIHLPSPTHWPIILAFGCTLAAGGLVTDVGISILGAVLMLAGCIGWFRQVLPHEAHEDVPVVVQPVTIASRRRVVERIQIHPEHRAHLPVETYPITSGLKGGIAGGIAMVIPAVIYGELAHGSIWWAVNLLGGAGVAHWSHVTDAQIAAFHGDWLGIAIVLQAIVCTLVGLLYGAMLPMLPRHPVLLGGVLAPLAWTGLLYSGMGIINPALNAHIAWGWFMASQVVFGVVAGLVVARGEKIRTGRGLPFVARMGIEAPGLIESNLNAGPPRPPSAQNEEKH
jgi:hypothetical protein